MSEVTSMGLGVKSDPATESGERLDPENDMSDPFDWEFQRYLGN
jgi:hypothetical protein